jgi:hypothetical protein
LSAVQLQKVGPFRLADLLGVRAPSDEGAGVGRCLETGDRPARDRREPEHRSVDARAGRGQRRRVRVERIVVMNSIARLNS